MIPQSPDRGLVVDPVIGDFSISRPGLGSEARVGQYIIMIIDYHNYNHDNQ